MPILHLLLEGDNAWAEIKAKKVIDLSELPIEMAILPGGMQSGKPSVAFRIHLPNGEVLFTQTSWALLYAACKAIEARYGEPE